MGDLEKLKLVKLCYGGLVSGSGFATASAASKNDTCFKSVQK